MNDKPRIDDATWVAGLLSVDPLGLGGVVLRGRPGLQRDRWLEIFRNAQSPGVAWRKVPVHVDDDRLLGGLDVAATLRAGKPVVASGLLAEADQGFLVLTMAERLQRGVAARICAVLDQGCVHLERDGIARQLPARFSVIALDEGLEDDQRLSQDLEDRLAFQLFIDDPEQGPHAGLPWTVKQLARARDALNEVQTGAETLDSLCGASALLGIGSMRGAWLALRCARATAALAGRTIVSTEDIQLATRLVLASRARQWPPDSDEAPAEPPQQSAEKPPEQNPQQEDQQAQIPTPDIPEELVLAAVKAALPPGLLARLQAAANRRKSLAANGRFGPGALSRRRGRPIGVHASAPRAGQRLNVGATLKAAAPWQKLRNAGPHRSEPNLKLRLQFRPGDFRVSRYKSRRESTTIFVVDASGSSATQRLAEAKGAVELLLAECYVRRDQVALIAFRGTGAELLLAPTRALARARRELAGMPGGGGTPLAAGIDSARELAHDLVRRGRHPVIVVMTDGRANIARDGTPGHQKANEEALAASRLLKVCGWSSIVVDTSSRPRPLARELAESMGAQYLPLPYADANALSGVVKAAVAS